MRSGFSRCAGIIFADMATPIPTTRDVVSDDALTVCAISILAAMLASILHEGFGHAAIALATGAKSGLLTAVAWSSESDSRLVAAGGTLVNLAAGAAFWAALRKAQKLSITTRYFLLISMAFNLFDGTGYFLFSGVSNFGDWARVIEGMQPHWMWRLGLFTVGVATYYASVLVVGQAYVRDLGIRLQDAARLRRLSLLPYISAIVIVGLAGLLNPISKALVWQSALPATAGAHSGLLWFRYYVPKKTTPRDSPVSIGRSYRWVCATAVSALIYVIVLGHGITLTP
jgi:hypothetical protein